MKNIVIVIFVALAGMKGLIAQTTLLGKVFDTDTHRPLSHCTIKVGGEANVLVTDEGGLFSLKTDKPTVILMISYTGYKKKEIQVDLPQKEVLLIPMGKEIMALEEVSVINTGYQNIPKERSTGSFEHIDSALFNRRVGPDVLSRLEGVTGSLLVDKRNTDQVKLQIRGVSTLYASDDPLIILDNFPYEGDINNINPNDIASVSVLKDAAAASIWGARAGNGVIVLTSKKGRYNQSVHLDLNTNLTIAQKPNLFNIPIMSTPDYIEAQKFLFKNGFYDSELNDLDYHPPVGPLIELLEKQKNNPEGDLAGISAIDQQIKALGKIDIRNDFEKYLYRSAINQQYALNLNGGNEKIKYVLSTGYDKTVSELKGNSSERFTFRFNQSLKPIKNLEISTNILYTQNSTQSNSPGGYFGAYSIGNRQLYPYTRFVNEAGNPLTIERNLRQSYIDSLQTTGLLDWSYRPLEELDLADNRNRGKDLRIGANGTYSFSSALKLDVRYQYGTYDVNGRNYHSAKTYFARDLINRFTDISSGKMIRNIPYGGILDENVSQLTENSIRSQLNFNKSWENDHQVVAIAGIEAREIKTQSKTTRTYGYDDNLLTFVPVDYVTEFPSYNNLFGSNRIEGNQNFGSLLNRFISLYSNVSYTYKKRYTVTGSARKDASNLFGVETNRKGVPLWSAGVLWNIADEPFYKIDGLSNLKLRLTYGFSGNLPTNQSALVIMNYQPATASQVKLPYATITNPPNPNLRWEKVGMFNMGLDFGLKGNRFSGTIEYFNKNVRDMLGNKTMDASTGFSSMVTNSANMEGRGVDINLSSVNTTGAVKWSSNVLFSYVKNKLTRFLTKPSVYANSYVNSGDLISIEGKMPYMVVSYKWAGLDGNNGNPQGFYNGELSQDYYNLVYSSLLSDAVFHGSPLPLYFGAIRNDISWKNLSFSLNISYNFDYYFRRNSIDYSLLASYGKGHSDFAQRWQKPGDEKLTNVPSFTYPLDNDRDNFYALSEATVERGDHIRLNDMQVNYSINKSGLFKQIQIYAYLNNLNIILWKANKKGVDPNFVNGLKAPLSIAFGLKTSL